MLVVGRHALNRPQISNIIGFVEFSASVNLSVNSRFYGRLCAKLGRGVDDGYVFDVGGCPFRCCPEGSWEPVPL
jgi:hypothetical protein